MNGGTLLLSVVLFSLPPAVAAADPVSLEPSRAFEQPPESLEVLADSFGGSAGANNRLRRLADSDAVGFLQQISRTSAVAMDNWWAQTGAALIDNNLLVK